MEPRLHIPLAPLLLALCLLPGLPATAQDRDDALSLETLGDPDAPRLYLTDPPDADGDGLGDAEELRLFGTAPDRRDTDGDGLSDLQEVALGRDPLRRDATSLRLREVVRFGPDAVAVGEAARRRLAAMADGVMEDPAVLFVVHGHADTLEAGGADLARRRAEAVEGVLISVGIPAYRIRVHTRHDTVAATGDPAHAPAHAATPLPRDYRRRAEVYASRVIHVLAAEIRSAPDP